MMARRKSDQRAQRWSVVVAGVLVVLLLAIGVGVVSFALSWIRGSMATPGGGIVPSAPGETNKSSENVSYGFGQILPKWTGQDRITVLLLGIDERAQESGPWRTDTIMLLTLDPTTLQAGVLSIPRDLWVPIPGYQDGRINTAHFLGDLYDYPGGGPALAVETVEYNLGTPIDYYVRINFHGFVSLVDQIGGVDVYVEEPINDPTYPDYHYGYDPLYIDEGWQHFDGEMALKYARTRHGSSDFERAERQQQVMMAILDRVTSYELMPELARNAPQLFQTLESSVTTNMALDQILALGTLALDVDRETIRFGVIDHTATQPWVTPQGGQVLIPLRDEMRAIRDYVFESVPATPAGVAQEAPAVDVPTPTPEVASVAILNGTGRGGLAGSTADYLRAQGIDVALVANADRQDYDTTVVMLNRNKPATLTTLLDALHLTSASVVQGTDSDAAQDIIVVLGRDYDGPPES